MPIEFRCSACEKLLRVPDDAAGKEAKCPNCAAVLAVPAASSPAESSSPFGPLPSQSSGADYDNPYVQPPANRPGEVNPYASPTAYADGMDVIASSAPSEIVPTRIDIGDVLSRAWEIFKANVWMSALATFVCWILPQIVSYAFAIPIGIAQGAGAPFEVIMVVQVLNWIVTIVIQTWIGIGQTMYFIQTARGNDPTFAVLFQGLPFFLRMIGYTILMLCLTIGILAVVCGIPFLITWAATGDPGAGAIAALIAAIPGIIPVAYISLMFAQTGNLIIDQNMGLIESLSVSKTVMNGNKLSVFVLGLISIPITIAGLLALCVGYFFAFAYVLCFFAVAYLVMCGQQTLHQPATAE